MFRIRWSAPLLLVALSGIARPALGQVAEIQVLPPDLNLTVGETGNVIATLFDERGNPITAAAPLTWESNRISVAVVEFNAAAPNFATVRAVSPGVAQITARSGAITSTVVVLVEAAPVEEPEVTPAVTPDSVLPGDVSNTSIGLVARVQTHNFGFAQECRVGGFVGPNLLLTTYVAIRGADSIEVVTPDGQRVRSGVRVAAYDAPSDLAVLHVPAQRSGEFTVGDDPDVDDYVWVVGQPNCRTTQATRARITSTPATGSLGLSQVMGLGQVGAPVINQAGEVVAMAAEGSAAIRATDLASMTTQARRNLATGSLLTPIQVARAERHAYGSIALRSNMTNATARIAPLEDWQWPELAQQNPLPLTFSGPEGRYRVELVASGAVQSTTTVTMEAGVANQVLLTPTLLAQQETPPPEEETPPGAQITPQGGGGGGGAIIAVVLALAGGGAAAAFLLKPKDGGNGNGNGSGVGAIRIVLPAR